MNGIPFLEVPAGLIKETESCRDALRSRLTVRHVRWDQILCRATDAHPLVIFRNLHQSYAYVLQDNYFVSLAINKSLVLVRFSSCKCNPPQTMLLL